jgi:glycosidase
MGHAAKAFAVLCATWNGIPLVYSGQELPNSQRLKFFEKDEIQWAGNFGLHNFYKTLLELHSNHPALRAADENVRTYRISTSEDEKIFSYLRKVGEREVLVILNLSAIGDLQFEIMGENVSGIYRNVFTGDSIDLTVKRELSIKEWDYFVFEK